MCYIQRFWFLSVHLLFNISFVSSLLNDVRMTMSLWMQILIMPILHTTTISNVLSNVLDLCVVFVTPSLQRSLSSRNQSIDLQSKSIDWFRYDRTSFMKELISNSCRFATKDFLAGKITVFVSMCCVARFGTICAI